MSYESEATCVTDKPADRLVKAARDSTGRLSALQRYNLKPLLAGIDRATRPPKPSPGIPERLLAPLFPRLCVHCKAPIEHLIIRHDQIKNPQIQNLLCADCVSRIRVADAGTCSQCGSPRPPLEVQEPTIHHESCGEPCPGGAPQNHLQGLFWCWDYSGPVTSLLGAMKFGRLDFLCSDLIPAALPTVDGHLPSVDWIVPVPLHWGRRWTRGYDQADLLAQAVADFLFRPFRRLLKRKRKTSTQSTLDRKSRARNLRHAFALKRGALPTGKRILLVDDVLTTGATLDAAAEPLRKAGALGIWGLTVARTPQKPKNR